MIRKLADVDAHEGPVYVPAEDALYFTTVRTDSVAIKRLSLDGGAVSVVRAEANMANGMTLDREGRLVICEQGTFDEPARISRMDLSTRELETVVEGRLNSPNEVVVARDGAIWFTDPSYGFLQGFRPEPESADCVYRYDGELRVVADRFDKPNGLAFSPDERVLYVGDSERDHILAFDVVDGRLERERLFTAIEPGYPDGIKVDEAGHVYSSFADGIAIFAPSGERVGEIPLPGAVNFTFGGPERDTLFITADTAVWAANLDAKGA